MFSVKVRGSVGFPTGVDVSIVEEIQRSQISVWRQVMKRVGEGRSVAMGYDDASHTWHCYRRMKQALARHHLAIHVRAVPAGYELRQHLRPLVTPILGQPLQG